MNGNQHKIEDIVSEIYKNRSELSKLLENVAIDSSLLLEQFKLKQNIEPIDDAPAAGNVENRNDVIPTCEEWDEFLTEINSIRQEIRELAPSSSRSSTSASLSKNPSKKSKPKPHLANTTVVLPKAAAAEETKAPHVSLTKEAITNFNNTCSTKLPTQDELDAKIESDRKCVELFQTNFQELRDFLQSIIVHMELKTNSGSPATENVKIVAEDNILESMSNLIELLAMMDADVDLVNANKNLYSKALEPYIDPISDIVSDLLQKLTL